MAGLCARRFPDIVRYRVKMRLGARRLLDIVGYRVKMRLGARRLQAKYLTPTDIL